MPRQRQKTGGRQKGTPNKEKTELLATIQNKYKGYHPVMAMADVANAKTKRSQPPSTIARKMISAANAEENFNAKVRVLAAMIKEIQVDAKAEVDLAFQANKEVAQYVAPKLKAVEVSGTLGIQESGLHELS